MNFEFSPEQDALRDEVRKVLARLNSLAGTRRIIDGDGQFQRDLWNTTAELGWLGAAVPEVYGGAGGGDLELCVLAEEFGRGLVSAPFASSAYLAQQAIIRFGNDDQKQRFLPGLADGSCIGTGILSDSRSITRGEGIKIRDGRLYGSVSPVPDGSVAHIALVAVPDTTDRSRLMLVKLDQPGVRRRALETIDPSKPHAELSFDGAEAELIGAASDEFTPVTELTDVVAVLMAFEQVGGAQASLDAARQHAVTRLAFGRQIGSFQAIKHRLADMYIAVQLARSNAYYGAWALSTRAPELAVAACCARISATEAFALCAKENIQIHGGTGYTWESDCHLYFRRAGVLGLALGETRVWQDRLIDFLAANPKSAAPIKQVA